MIDFSVLFGTVY